MSARNTISVDDSGPIPRDHDHHAHAVDPALERFLFFTDAVFAIALTLLVIEIKVPRMPSGAGEAAWEGALVDLTPGLFAFVLSFFVVGSVWTAHHALFRFVAKFDPRMLAPNLIMLLSLTLTPLSSALMGQSTAAPAPYVCYSAVLLAAGLAKAWLAVVALRPELVGPSATPRAIAVMRRRSCLMPAAASLALVLAFLIPAWNNAAMLLLLVAGRLPMFRLAERSLPRLDRRERPSAPLASSRLGEAADDRHDDGGPSQVPVPARAGSDLSAARPHLDEP